MRKGFVSYYVKRRKWLKQVKGHCSYNSIHKFRFATHTNAMWKYHMLPALKEEQDFFKPLEEEEA